MGDSAGTSGTVPILLKRMADQNVGRSAELILPKIVAQLERDNEDHTDSEALPSYSDPC